MEEFACGHPRTAENTFGQIINGKLTDRCKTCAVNNSKRRRIRLMREQRKAKGEQP